MLFKTTTFTLPFVIFVLFMGVTSAAVKQLRNACAFASEPYCTVLDLEGNLSAPSALSNGGALQKHANVRQTVAPLATFLMHVIALATRPPRIASRLSDRLFHLWV